MSTYSYAETEMLEPHEGGHTEYVMPRGIDNEILNLVLQHVIEVNSKLATIEKGLIENGESITNHQSIRN